MTVDLRHLFVSPVASTGSNRLVQGPNWNEAHNLQQGPQALLGRSDAVAGQAATQEIQLDPSLGFVGGKLAAIAGGPPSGPAGGDLAGTYPSPTIKPSVTNGQVLTTVGGVSAWATPAVSGGTVTSTSVVSANGLAGTVATATTTPAITLSTTVTGMVKGNGTTLSAATAGTDYMTPANVSAAYQPLDADLTALAGLNATAGLVEQTAAATYTKRLIGVANTTDIPTRANADARYAPISVTGTVTSTSVVSANGFAGTVATAATTPAITLSTSITGMLKGNGTAISAGVAGTDYVTPGGLTTALGSYLALTGGTLAGPGTLTGTTATFATSTQAGGSGTGAAKLNSGGTNAGYIEFDKADGTRVGYIGLFTDRLVYNADIGYHDFVGSLNGTTATFSGAISTNGFTAGYLEVPQNAQTASYTAVLADSGKHLYHAVAAAAATYTIPANASVAYPLGATLTFVNDSANNVTIAITTDTLVLSPGTTTGSRTLATGGVATALKVTSTRWIINGTGLT